MSQLDRRQSLKLFLGGLLTSAGTVLLAKTVLPIQAGPSETQEAGAETGNKTQQDSQKDLAERADRVAEAQGSRPNGDGQEPCTFANSFSNSFKNGGSSGGAFKNGGFTNGGGGSAFKNGGFANGGGGGGAFKNSAFANGGGGGGAFKNGAFANGGFRN